jgi:hypothetical protein
MLFLKRRHKGAQQPVGPNLRTNLDASDSEIFGSYFNQGIWYYHFLVTVRGICFCYRPRFRSQGR